MLTECSHCFDKCRRYIFNQSTKTGIRNVPKKMCVIALVMFYENRTNNATKVYRVLSCVLCPVIYNYVCIDFLCCQSKTISDVSGDIVFEKKIYNELIGIGIPEVLINLIILHGFMKNKYSTVILVCSSRLVNYYIKKG